ncbi:peptidoglycan-associated lipoprotein Pal [Desulfuromonas acetoxidans]|uniref:Peptidoglycan-associated lipoprotein n=1 Tax=Desulfuromonas acetoxidans (strain DSM 684 / 11070) TaxID=281689 RepID=Q1JZD6_DESA6|nr:peptidoglycan-associated lipoprotein Pal [Desulfuromonas acetoxidans]EAT15631.1 OmpA/MotB [Desulfuromonas acetoxidans DSM 684]MBF0645742.1 peptidoglycan-associated lipoprotein Pal [Desulfuromonas acetoxidans]NVD25224.1 peptidoglycan-associated lipoprotein Pal [Desulfuromonas acetoxidans]NVE17154.1 peptidoglycan-associated lipoprotein Pal [Desulfuromonas acetoxidans]
MKTFKLLCLFALILILAAGCAKPVTEDTGTEEACEVTEVAPTTEPVPSYTDSAVTETTPAVEPVAAPVLGTVYFEFDQYTLSAEARDTLAENMRYLQANPGTTLVIEGHCDERGSDEYNLALGERRAVAAQQYLTSMGVATDRLSTISYGEEKPVDMASTEEAWAKNRRAEFVPKP